LALFAFLAIANNVPTEEAGVIVLTDKNFDEVINSHNYTLVEFYAPWCGHCQKLAPEYAKAAQRLQKEGSSVKLAKLDATTEKEVATRFRVGGFPTLKFFTFGTPVEYKGGRTEQEIVNWIKKKTEPPLRQAKDLDYFEDQIRDFDVVVVFWGDESQPGFSTFEQVSKSGIEEAEFLWATDPEIKEKYRRDPAVQVTVYKRFDDFQVNYDDELQFEALKAWVVRNTFPIVIDFTGKTTDLIFGRDQIPKVLLFVEKSEKSEVAAKVFRKVAEKVFGQARFVQISFTDSTANKITEFVGVKQTDLPAIRLVATSEQGSKSKYKFEEDITFENIIKFLQDYNSKNLRSYLKSEDPPANNNGPVKTVVATTWKKIVLDPSKDVLVELYAPWCGHCKKLAPEYEKAAARLQADYPNVILAKMDATANEIDGVSANGYPTLKWYPAFKKHLPQDFASDIRSEEAIVNWVEKKASHKKNASDQKPISDDL